MSLIARRWLWAALALAFAAINAWALQTSGVDGVVAYLTSLGPIGVLATVDLLLALLVGLAFVLRDARERADDARPFVAMTLATGSLGLLAYLARRRDRAERTPEATLAEATRGSRAVG